MAGESSDVTEGEANQAVLDVADCHFHCSFAIALPTSLCMPLVANANRPVEFVATNTQPPVLSRPERPQWADYA